MQQASAGGNGDDNGDSGGNSLEIKQKQDCERAGCDQTLDVDNTQEIDGFPPGPP
jgi:hypothetical protein